MISSKSDGRVRRAVASEVVDLGIIPSPVKPKTQKLVSTAEVVDLGIIPSPIKPKTEKLVSTAFLFDAQH